MSYHIVRLDPQPVCANLHLKQPEQSGSVPKWKKRHANLSTLGKLSKPPCGCRIVKEGNSLLYFSSLKPSRRGLGQLHVAKFSRESQSVTRNPSPFVEKGKYSYDVETVINKLSSLAPRGSVARCLEPHKKKLSLNDFSFIFREFAQRGDWQRTLRLFKYMQRQQWCKPNEHIYTIVIGILGREGLLDKCSEIFEEMPEQGVDWDAYSFTALINAYGRNGQYETSLHLLARMKREKITPNLITYNTIINACAKGGYDWEGLLGLFAEMRHKGIQPDIITYNTLLGACASRGLYNEAEMVFRTMNEAGIVPNTFTYTYLVETFAQAALLDRVPELFGEMESAGNFPDVTGYNLLLEAYAKSGTVKKAVGVFRQMQNAGCTPNSSTYSTLLSCYGKSGQYDDVRELFLSMKASSTEPDVVTYNILIDVFGKGGYYQEVISLFHDMVRENVEPLMETYNGIMLACARGGLHEDAKQILKHMQNREIVPSVEVFNRIIDAYGSAALYEDAIVVFNTMNVVGSEPNEETYNSIIEMYARGALDVEAYAFLDRMDEAGMDAYVETQNALIESSGRVGDFDDGIEIFDYMQQSYSNLNHQTYEAILNLYCIAGMAEEGRTLFMEIKERGLVPSVVSYCLMLSMYARLSRLIGNAVERAKAFVEEQKQEWTKFGCTILSDGWTDGKSRTIINFLACCNDNVVFLKSIDASNKVKNAQTLALMLENMVLEIGIENVVQIITDNAAAYVSAGKLLQQRHPTLSWTPCAAHVLDLLLEDMGKLDWVTPIVEDARRVTKYIYNHPWVLSLMREHTDGKEIVRPAVTRFATIFLTLQSILDNLASLKQMFVSKKWLASTFSKKSEGANVLRIVFDKYFEDKANEIVKVSEPLVGVLRLVDGDQTPMGELYEAMDKAKESVKNYYKGESIKYEPIWQIIDRRWNNQLHQPIHAAGYFLNPRFRADGTYADPDGEVIRGLSECVEKMVTSEETRDKIIAEQEIFTSAGGKVFSTSLCKRARLTQTPVAWWTTWGASTPNLAKFALRILSQPCSASHCERNWSLFEAIHTKKRNRLSQKRMNDMVYVQYNLKLRMKKAQQDPPGPIDLDEIDPYYDWTAQERAPLFTQEDISNLEREAAEEAAEEEGGGTGYDIDLDDIEEGDDEDDDIELTAEDLDILRAANVELPTSSSIATPSPALAQTQTRAQTLRGSSSRALPSPALASKATGKRKM